MTLGRIKSCNQNQIKHEQTTEHRQGHGQPVCSLSLYSPVITLHAFAIVQHAWGDILKIVAYYSKSLKTQATLHVTTLQYQCYISPNVDHKSMTLHYLRLTTLHFSYLWL